ncbi:C-C motif chemokine 24 isoform X2 [Canis lupus dingo]|nr:C-C motif chemokine 24 isoform X2 [Canis lupus dingo]
MNLSWRLPQSLILPPLDSYNIASSQPSCSSPFLPHLPVDPIIPLEHRSDLTLHIQTLGGPTAYRIKAELPALGPELLLQQMAGLATFVVSLLLVTLCAHCIDPAGSVSIPSSCCMFFISKKVPENRVVTYQLLNGSVCPKAGVVFTTKKNQKFCGDPQLHWVQKLMKNIEARRKKVSPGVRAMSTKALVQRYSANSTSI